MVRCPVFKVSVYKLGKVTYLLKSALSHRWTIVRIKWYRKAECRVLDLESATYYYY